MTRPNIVIVGGGAGGLELATHLGNTLGKKGKANIHLVDRNATHLWKPLLHEVATGSLDSGIDEISYRGHGHYHHFTFHLGTFCKLDREDRTLTLSPMLDANNNVVQPERTLPYDYLVLALGSQTNDFGTPGAAEHCAFLDSRSQADQFHRHLIETYLRLSNQAERGEKVVLKVGIVGAGATGVELAAELHNTTALLSAYGIHLTSDNLKVQILEAGDRILPALPGRLSAAVVNELKALNIDVLTGTRITQVSDKGFTTADGTLLEADIRVWAAGVKAPDVLNQIGGLQTNRSSQIEVRPTLQSVTDERIFAIGDCASCTQADGSRVPPRAQAAHQMASLVSQNLKALLKNGALKDYIYKDHGSLVSLSSYSAVGSLMGNLSGKSMMIEGKMARLVYISLYRLHQIALHGYIRTLLIMFSARINRIIRPRLKLH
ncbi:MAG: NAD(P)/FAD-dependent oxidoreductase [Hahellaceae bacterium]|nr:NAD(P)/FAD-dependent oxidoreductase [Hahellaceae bacterium]